MFLHKETPFDHLSNEYVCLCCFGPTTVKPSIRGSKDPELLAKVKNTSPLFDKPP